MGHQSRKSYFFFRLADYVHGSLFRPPLPHALYTRHRRICCTCIYVKHGICCCRRLSMVASRPVDVAKDQPRVDASSPSSASASASSPSPPRPLLPAERDINTAMNGFNAGVVNFLKGKVNKSTAVFKCDVFFFFSPSGVHTRMQSLPASDSYMHREIEGTCCVLRSF